MNCHVLYVGILYHRNGEQGLDAEIARIAMFWHVFGLGISNHGKERNLCLHALHCMAIHAMAALIATFLV